VFSYSACVVSSLLGFKHQKIDMITTCSSGNHNVEGLSKYKIQESWLLSMWHTFVFTGRLIT